jgi:hypothetical protein
MRMASSRGAGAAPPGHDREPYELGSAPVFRCEGDYWTVIYDGALVRLRDTKGLHLLAYLLRRPDQAVAAPELLLAGEQAAAQTTRPGRSKTKTPDREQARIAVTKHLKAAVARIEARHPSLGYHLRAAIQTGTQCAYRPDPTHPIEWTL